MQEFKALLNQYKNRINLGIVLRAVLGNVLLFVGGLHLYFILWLVLGAYSPALIYANIGIRIGLALSIIYVVWQAYRDMWSHFKMARYLDLKHNAQDDLYQNAW